METGLLLAVVGGTGFVISLLIFLLSVYNPIRQRPKRKKPPAPQAQEAEPTEYMIVPSDEQITELREEDVL